MTHTHAATDDTLGDSELCGDEDPDTAMDAYSWKCRLPKNHSGSHISTSGKKWENENVTQGGVPPYVGSGLEPHSHCPSCGGRLWPKQQTFVECEDCGLRYPMSKPKAQGSVPSDSSLDADVEAWHGAWERMEAWDGNYVSFIDRLIAERKVLREEVERLQSDLQAVTENWKQDMKDKHSLQAENTKLIAWQKAAAEERIALRERLNEARSSVQQILEAAEHRETESSDAAYVVTLASDALAALTEQQEQKRCDDPDCKFAAASHYHLTEQQEQGSS